MNDDILQTSSAELGATKIPTDLGVRHQTCPGWSTAMVEGHAEPEQEQPGQPVRVVERFSVVVVGPFYMYE